MRFGASEWVASGAGGFSGVGNAAKKSDLSAAGTSGFTANANTLVETELSADGVGAFSGVGNALFRAYSEIQRLFIHCQEKFRHEMN